MANLELKKKILNTLKQYEQQIEALQAEMAVLKGGSRDSATDFSIKINNSLYQLINHLSIPEDLDSKKEQIKQALENKLSGEHLCQVLNQLTELVVDSFNVEQKRFKHFLEKLTHQLHDFDKYLKTSFASHQKASMERDALETGIEDSLSQIKQDMGNATSVEALSAKISANFDLISERLRDYRDSQNVRESEQEQLVKSLQAQLIESEKTTEEVKNLLSFQKNRINQDSLTELPNRASYNEHISEAFSRWKRNGQEFSIAIADVDFFKNINDTFGHLAGDKVLKKIASIFRTAVRAVDFIARIGGEEFVFIFEQTTSQTACVVLEKLRKLVQDCQFYYQGKKVDVTVSFGVAEVTPHDDLESLFIRADNALYQAKRGGRNRVELL